MAGTNQKLYPEFTDISNYPQINRVFAKLLERNEQVLLEIRDALIEHNRLHAVPPTQKPAPKPRKSKPKVTKCK